MRYIKFRAWNKKLNMMCGVFTLLEAVQAEPMIMATHDVFMQYTGLKDKNGKEIYEGDIVVCGDRPEPIKVTFKEGCFYTHDGCGKYRLGGWNKKAVEVVGNIYENPDLHGNV